nr:hypothetical protein [Tanacetum cinerariifolium]
MTYSMLLEFVVKRLYLDPNVWFNLSFNLPVIFTNDDDVEFFIDCATNSITDKIPNLYIRPPIVEASIIPGPVGILQKVLARKKADIQARGSWLQAIVYLHDEGVIVSGCLGDMKKHCIKGKLKSGVGVVKSCTPNSLGDMTVTLKDPTGIVYAVTSRHTQMRNMTRFELGIGSYELEPRICETRTTQDHLQIFNKRTLKWATKDANKGCEATKVNTDTAAAKRTPPQLGQTIRFAAMADESAFSIACISEPHRHIFDRIPI